MDAINWAAEFRNLVRHHLGAVPVPGLQGSQFQGGRFGLGRGE